jgi:mono/diheme cytochrome c family protein
MSDKSASPSNPSGPHHAPGGLAGGTDAIGDDALQAMHARLLHEKEEPTEGFSVIPIILIFVGCILTYLNGVDLATHAGAFKWNVYSFNWTPGSEVSGPPDLMKIGARVFKEAQCANCHGPEGAGQPGQYPPLAGSPWPVGDPKRPISIVLIGMNGNITVEGNNVPNGSMPYVGQSMSDLNIAAVLTYVRASFGNHDGPVDPALVSQLRADLGKRPPFTPQEILKEYPLEANKPAAPAPAAGTAPAAGSAPAAAPAAASGN